MQKQPKTIADLKINWVFDYNFEDLISPLVQKLNPNIYQLKIVNDKYSFTINNCSFEIETSNSTLGFLLKEIDCKVFSLQEKGLLSKVLTLINFELISENTFRIHVKE